MDKKTRQHYVWQQYLKAWTSEDELVKTLFKSDKKIVYTNSINIGVKKKYIYN